MTERQALAFLLRQSSSQPTNPADAAHAKSAVPGSPPLQHRSRQASRKATEDSENCCSFCRQDDPTCGELIGPFDGHMAHEMCAMWSPRVYEDVDKLRNVEKEIRRGSRITCAKCRRVGATLGCHISACPRSYHYACAREIATFDESAFLIGCPNHPVGNPKSKQSASAAELPSASQSGAASRGSRKRKHGAGPSASDCSDTDGPVQRQPLVPADLNLGSRTKPSVPPPRRSLQVVTSEPSPAPAPPAKNQEAAKQTAPAASAGGGSEPDAAKARPLQRAPVPPPPQTAAAAPTPRGQPAGEFAAGTPAQARTPHGARDEGFISPEASSARKGDDAAGEKIAAPTPALKGEAVAAVSAAAAAAGGGEEAEVAKTLWSSGAGSPPRSSSCTSPSDGSPASAGPGGSGQASSPAHSASSVEDLVPPPEVASPLERLLGEQERERAACSRSFATDAFRLEKLFLEQLARATHPRHPLCPAPGPAMGPPRAPGAGAPDEAAGSTEALISKFIHMQAEMHRRFVQERGTLQLSQKWRLNGAFASSAPAAYAPADLAEARRAAAEAATSVPCVPCPPLLDFFSLAAAHAGKGPSA
eukprot:tig00020537_g10236.t1